MAIYTGRVRHGVVVLDNGNELAEGTLVRIEPLEEPVASTAQGRARLLSLAGTITDLPSDLARIHDHYLYGHQKE